MAAKQKDKWMQKAFPQKTKGKLHRRLGVAPDQPIPSATLEHAYAQARKKKDTTLMRQINLAKRGAAISRRHARKSKGDAFTRGVKGGR